MIRGRNSWLSGLAVIVSLGFGVSAWAVDGSTAPPPQPRPAVAEDTSPADKAAADKAAAEKAQREAAEKKRRQEEEKKKREEEARKRREAAEKKRQQDERAFLNQLDILRELDARRKPSANEKNHERIRKAFRDSVAGVRESVAIVMADGEQCALGAIVTADGCILTKASELRGKLEVRFSNGKLRPAEVVGFSDPHDLALLKVDAADLKPVAWSEEAPTLGSWLATPSTDELPLAVGVVSVAPRGLRPRGILGVALKLDASQALIEQVLPNSPAAKAGLQPNDIITKVEGTIVATGQKVMELLRERAPGEKVQLNIQRGEEEKAIEAVLSPAPGLSQDRLNRFNRMNLIGGDLSERRWNFPTALQHDTILRPEDCGGPIVDLDGKVVGLNIARTGRIDSYALTTSIIAPLVEEMRSGKLAPPADFDRQLQVRSLDHRVASFEKDLRAAEREKALAERKIADAQKALDNANKQRESLKK